MSSSSSTPRILEEYRFQVRLNWSRTQYFLVLNIGIVGVATATLPRQSHSNRDLPGAGLYLIGLVVAALCVIANQVQHEYYRSIRDQKNELERVLDLGEHAISTTPGMVAPGIRHGWRRLGRVTTLVNVVLVLVAVVDASGLAYALGLVH